MTKNSIDNIDIWILSSSCHSGLNFLATSIDSHQETIAIPSLGFFNKLYHLTNLKDYKNFNVKNEKKFLINFVDLLYSYGKRTLECKFLNNKIEKKNFLRIFLEIYKNYEEDIFLKKIFFSLHLAFVKFFKMDLRKKKVIIVYEKSTIYIPFYFEFFKKSKVLLLIRNPINSYSGYKTSYIKKNTYFSLNAFNYFFAQMNSCLRFIHKRNIMTIKNEDMNNNFKKEMNKICKIMKIKFSNSLLKTTVLNNKYGSDSSYLLKEKKNYSLKPAPKLFHKEKNQLKRSLNVLNNFEILVIQSLFSKIFTILKYKYVLPNNFSNFIKGYLYVITFHNMYSQRQISLINKLKNLCKRLLILLFNKNKLYFWLNLT